MNKVNVLIALIHVNSVKINQHVFNVKMAFFFKEKRKILKMVVKKYFVINVLNNV